MFSLQDLKIDQHAGLIGSKDLVGLIEKFLGLGLTTTQKLNFLLKENIFIRDSKAQNQTNLGRL